MSTKITIRPEQLRQLAQGMRNANERNLESIKSRIATRNTQNKQLASNRKSRETTLCDNMFVQVDNTGLSQLMNSFTDSYHKRDPNRRILNRVDRHTIPTSMTNRFLTSLSGVAINDTRWFVGGTQWNESFGAIGDLRRTYQSVNNTIQMVLTEVDRQRGVLGGFARSGVKSRYYKSSSGVADKAFISRLNHVSNDAIEAFVGIGSRRSGRSDAIVKSVDNVLDTLRRNINIAKATGEELARQAESLANSAESFDRQAANRLFSSGSMRHTSQLTRSQVKQTIYRPNLLTDGRGLENARSEQNNQRHRTLKRNLTRNLYEVADFIANPTGRGNIATLCANALTAISQWEGFINRDVAVEIKEPANENTPYDPQHILPVRPWGTRQSLRRTLGSYLPGDIVADIQAAKRVLNEWQRAFTNTMNRAKTFTTAMNNDAHVRNLDKRTERAIYPPADLTALQNFARNTKRGLESQAAVYQRFARTILNQMDGQTARAYAGALQRGANYFLAIAQTIETDFWQGNYSGNVDRTSSFKKVTHTTSKWSDKSTDELVALMIVNGEVQWDVIESIMGLSYNSMTDEMFMALAVVFAEVDDDDISKFLGYLADEVASFGTDSTAWEYCPNKTGMLQVIMSLLPDNGADNRISTQQRQALLGSLVELTTRTEGRGVDRRTFVLSPAGQRPRIVLEVGDCEFNNSYTRVTVPTVSVTYPHHLETSGGVEKQWVGTGESSWRISSSVGSNTASGYVNNHQREFNNNAFVTSGWGNLGGNTIDEIIGAGIGSATGPVAPGAMVVINTIRSVAENEQTRQQLGTANQLTDASDIASSGADMPLTFIVVRQDNGPAIVNVHPVPDITQNFIDAVNGSGFFEGTLTMNALLSNTLTINNWWRRLTDREQRDILDEAGYQGWERGD